MKPKVSIIMPVLNGERLIGEAIQSILAQTYTNYELVVIDDGSTDGTCARVHTFKDKLELKYVRHTERRGIAPSMSDGIRHSSGDFIAFLDHDDMWLPDFLETQVRYLLDHPDVGMVHCDFRTIDVQGNVLEESVAKIRGRIRPSGNVFRELFLDSFIVGIGVLIRKECFDRLGTFDESLHWGDYHMWLRIARHYRVDYQPKVLASYRQHPAQSTRSTAVSRPDEDSVAMQAIKKLLDTYPEIRQELGEELIRRRTASLYFDMAYSWLSKGAPRNARMCVIRAIPLWPTNWRYYVVYAASFVGAPPDGVIRRTWRATRRLLSFGKTAANPLERMNAVR